MQAVNFVESADDVERLWRWMSAEPLIATDTETTGFGLYDDDFSVRLIQFGSPTEAWVVDFQRWRGLVEDIFIRYQGDWVMHNARFDVTGLAQEGIAVPWHRLHDTMVQMRLARPTESAALKNAADKYISPISSDAQKVLREAFRRQGWNWATVPIDFPPYRFYAALDPILTARLYHTPVCREGRESDVYALEMQTKAVCSRMEQNGLRIDRDFCRRNAERLREHADALKAEMDSRHGISITSAMQLSHWFASRPDALEWMTKETHKGKLSVDKEVLHVLVGLGGEVGEMASAVLAVRRDEKIAGSYLENFLRMSDGDDLLHPQIETVAARTGRMSVKEPGLQTLPKPTVESDYRIVREGIVPFTDDEVIISCDLDQVELRLAAIISKDQGLIDAFAAADAGEDDFFTLLAQGVYRDPTITKDNKRRARIKTFSYASLYGASVRKMAISAGVPVAEMRDIRDDMAARFPGFFSMGLEAQHQLRENGGYIKTLFGRKLPVDESKEYVSTNYLIQGSAADLLKRSLVLMAQAGLEEYMLVPVHDEIVLSVPHADADEVGREVERAMTSTEFSVPITASSSTGDNWAAAK
jgi:DNA polymerase-1